MFENSTGNRPPSAVIASVLLVILALFSVLTFFFGNTNGREVFYSLIYSGLVLSMISSVFGFRFLSAARRAAVGKGKAIAILVLNLLIFLTYVGLTILVIYDNTIRGRNMFGK